MNVQPNILFRQRYKNSDYPNSEYHDFYQLISSYYSSPQTLHQSAFASFSVEVILDYLKRTHTYYLDTLLMKIDGDIENVLSQTRQPAGLSTACRQLFRVFRSELVEHIEAEEEHLFPYIEALVRMHKNESPYYNIAQKVALINYLITHNDQAEKRLDVLIELVTAAEKSHGDLFGLHILRNRLELFARDLWIHASIEDHVLMPRAIEMEHKIFGTLTD